MEGGHRITWKFASQLAWTRSTAAELRRTLASWKESWLPDLSSDLHTCTPALPRRSTCLCTVNWVPLTGAWFFSVLKTVLESDITGARGVAVWGGCCLSGCHVLLNPQVVNISFWDHQPSETMTSFHLNGFPSALSENMSIHVRGWVPASERVGTETRDSKGPGTSISQRINEVNSWEGGFWGKHFEWCPRLQPCHFYKWKGCW